MKTFIVACMVAMLFVIPAMAIKAVLDNDKD